ncbi:MAG TPA: Zn-ribbon domain-containing OB-fold protein [Anaerolineae bacterium]|nr:Zn-ribbon domain-containing OB-fold protein [Anaerolineae bacterium]
MSLLERLERVDEAKAWPGEIPITSRYTVGLAGERFFREIKDNARFLGTRCQGCGITYVPPRLYCERCFAKLDDWVEVKPTGTVHTYTVLHLALDGSPLEEPEILAFIVLDGSDGGLVHRLGEVAPDEVEIGMRVEAVFKPKAERKGSMLDIEYFRPIGS